MLNLILNLSRLEDPKLRISKSVDCGTQKFYPSFLLLVTKLLLFKFHVTLVVFTFSHKTHEQGTAEQVLLSLYYLLLLS